MEFLDVKFKLIFSFSIYFYITILIFFIVKFKRVRRMSSIVQIEKKF